jgi:hypothetical protein
MRILRLIHSSSLRARFHISCQPEVIHPANNAAVECFYPLDVASGEDLSHLVREFLYRFAVNTHPYPTASGIERETQKLASPGSAHCAFLLVETQLQLAFRIVCYALHDSLSSPLAFYIDVIVIGATAKFMPSLLSSLSSSSSMMLLSTDLKDRPEGIPLRSPLPRRSP